MALITTARRVSDFAARPSHKTIEKFKLLASVESVAQLRTIQTIGELSNVTRVAQPVLPVFAASSEARGLAVKSITLTGDFRSFIGQLFDTASDVYYVAWCWDMSGAPIEVYPGQASQKGDVSFVLRPGESQRFMGAGSVLFPERPIAGGLAVRLQVWESHQKSREFGATLQSVCDTIRGSELNSLLTGISAATGLPGLEVSAIEQAVLLLGSAVGEILKEKSDDFVDLYEGYFPVNDPWTPGEFSEGNHATEMVFTRIAGAAPQLPAAVAGRVAVPV